MTSRPMSNIDKQWLQHKIADMEAACDEIPFGLDEDDSNTLAAMKLALASLEAEAVAFRSKLQPPTAIGSERWDYTDHRQPDAFELENCFIERLFTAPPAPANAEPVAWLWSHRKHPIEVTLVRPEDDERAEGAHWSGWSCQALYAAPPAPVSVPEWTNEQCLEFLSIAFRHAEIKGDLELDDIRLGVKMANGSRAAMLQGSDTELQRKAAIHDALCQKYNVESLEAFVDWQRNHITELEAAPPAPVGPGEPAVMPDYPGYVMTQRECFKAGAKRAVPDGWVAVPIEPTEDMIVNGFESEPDESFSDAEVWEAYDAMSGCQQAAHRAKLCWAAMIAAAPKPEA